jgi:hypothetical protein
MDSRLAPLFVVLLALPALAQTSTPSCDLLMEGMTRRLEALETRLERRHGEDTDRLDELRTMSSTWNEHLHGQAAELAPRIDAANRRLTDVQLSLQFQATLLAVAGILIASVGVLLWRHLARAETDIRVLQKVRLGTTTAGRIPASMSRVPTPGPPPRSVPGNARL